VPCERIGSVGSHGRRSGRQDHGVHGRLVELVHEVGSQSLDRVGAVPVSRRARAGRRGDPLSRLERPGRTRGPGGFGQGPVGEEDPGPRHRQED
jgi:hypothetical protein